MIAMANTDTIENLAFPAGKGSCLPLSRRNGLWLRASLLGLFWLTVCLAFPHAAKADSQKEPLRSYIVRKGDSLYGIGRKQGLSVSQLKSLNGLRGDRIKPGQRLILERPAASPQRWSLTTERLDDVAPSGLRNVIENYLDTPYRFGGTGQNGIDCSAFVQKVFLELDIALPRSAREQYWYGEEIDPTELNSGDLLFFRTYAKYPSHVGIYLGDGKMVHASARSHRVVTSNIDQPYYRKRFIGAKRFPGVAAALTSLGNIDAGTEELAEDEETADSIESAPPFNLVAERQ